MVNRCHSGPTADLYNSNFHPRATALHRLNLPVLSGWNKSKDGDEEPTFYIVLVTLVALSPGRMSPPLLHRQTHNTRKLLQAAVLCPPIYKPGFTSLLSIGYFIYFYEGHLITSSTEGVVLSYSPCRERSEWTALPSHTILKVTILASMKCFFSHVSIFFFARAPLWMTLKQCLQP